MDIGSCFADQNACRAARAIMVGGSHEHDPVSECTAQATASCFEVKRGDAADEQMCAPTLAMCRDHADHERLISGVASVSACARSGPTTAPSDDVHWWCVSFAGGRIGSCERSKVRCEADRDEAVELERGHPIDVSECTAQPAAQCFDAGRPDDRSMFCYPTIETCRSHLRKSKPQLVASDDDCRAVG